MLALLVSLALFSAPDRPPRDDRYWGISLASLGDLDGDGRAEFVVAARWARYAVYLCSGRDGRVLEGFLEGRRVPSFSWESLIAGEDYDGDGRPDFVVTLSGEGVVVEEKVRDDIEDQIREVAALSCGSDDA